MTGCFFCSSKSESLSARSASLCQLPVTVTTEESLQGVSQALAYSLSKSTTQSEKTKYFFVFTHFAALSK